ncbi:YcxB family protein [Variovorax sp. PAMC26660]|uniref:YcxB family protein n=1 Tax=Variovorax sp. PAMC26660 TaxID=2762322 RepID=UPI00164D4BEC|nr:YcxB family protein [Variovorax sp. PAMC26660]QNK67487.1 YcxB family protein [Variovorax sp. PAMC26660]
MIAKFRISEDDYAAAIKVSARPSRMRRALLIVMVVVLVLSALIGAAIGSRRLWPFTLASLFCGAVVLLLTFFLAPMLARRHYRKYKGMQEEFGAELLDNGLRIMSPHADGTVVWANVLKWRQSDRFVLIYLMPRLFHVLPKSVAEQGFDLQGLIERLNRHVGPES